jgi:hypothetical protein
MLQIPPTVEGQPIRPDRPRRSNAIALTKSANLPRLIGRHALSVALRDSRSASVLKASFVATRHDVALLSQKPLHTLRQDRHARHVSPTDTAQQEHTNETTMRFVVCPNRQRSRLRRSYPWFSSIKHRLTFRPRSTMSSRVAVSPQRTAGPSPARHPRSAPASPAAPRTSTRPVAPTKAGIPDFSCHHAPGHGWRPFAAMPAGLASA